MELVHVRRLDGRPGTLEPEKIEEFAKQTGPGLILEGDPEYERTRRVWNGMIDRRPGLIVRPRGAADVMAAVGFAREHDLLLSVRGGGHNVAGFGTCDGGMVIDLSRMQQVRVDPRSSTVRVGGGATWADVDRETQVFGLAVPGGIVSTTGVAGLTLGGGQGWLRRTHGMTCDSLLSADVVTAEGRFLVAGDGENTDLFWALRGGGGNFGLVTSFEFRAYPVGPMIAFAGPVYPLESAGRVMSAVRDFAAQAPDEVNISTTWWTIPEVPAFPPELHGRAVIVVGGVYAGPPERGETVLQPLRQIETPLLDLSGTIPYGGLQQMFDPFFPSGTLQYYWKSIYLAGLGDDVVRTVAEYVARRPSSLSMVAIWALGGALGRVDAGSTATGSRGAPYMVEILANWADPSDAETNIRWARELFADLERFGTGKTNVNFPGLGDDPGFGRAAFGNQWTRLVEIKRKYDPTNLFRLNQNIPPE